MFQNLVKRIRKSTRLAQSVREVSRKQRIRREHSCLAWKEGDWWFCRTTTAAARQLALQGAVVRVGRGAHLREGPWRRIPGVI